MTAATGLWIVALVLCAALAYWVIVVTEGAYLGPRAVTWLYDRGASTYDGVKDYYPPDEHVFLVEPLLQVIPSGARVLDVATGTARLPLALLADPRFRGEVVGVDLSTRMLAEAWTKVGGWTPRVQLVHSPAESLPFDDAAFDGVVMLEALEFTGRPLAALAALVRVLRPGGTLMVTNRVGWEARLMPGRAFRPEDFEQTLRRLGVEEVETRPWQVYYDLVLARKPGHRLPGSPDRWPASTRCPHSGCGGPLEVAGASPAALRCRRCGSAFPWERGAWRLSDRPTPAHAGSEPNG